MWVCVHCQEISEDDSWEECLSCGGHRDRSAATYAQAQEKIREIEAVREQLSRCTRCQGDMKFRGLRRIPHDLSGSDHVDYESEKFAVYYCTRCGKVELFLAEFGSWLRGDPQAVPE